VKARCENWRWSEQTKQTTIARTAHPITTYTNTTTQQAPLQQEAYAIIHLELEAVLCICK
jgi:hypothetical protein